MYKDLQIQKSRKKNIEFINLHKNIMYKYFKHKHRIGYKNTSFHKTNIKIILFNKHCAYKDLQTQTHSVTYKNLQTKTHRVA